MSKLSGADGASQGQMSRRSHRDEGRTSRFPHRLGQRPHGRAGIAPHVPHGFLGPTTVERDGVLTDLARLR
jgi:hypothetical protein